MLRRSSRPAKQINYSEPSIYPDVPPASELERAIDSLNLESFDCGCYAQVDDVLVYSLFSNKRNPGYYRAYRLETVYKREISAENGIAINNIVLTHISASEPMRGECASVAEQLVPRYSDLFDKCDKKVVEQYIFVGSMRNAADS